MVSELG